ncbi:MAG: rod shape-determining protein MreD [Planctomycetota bacterium]
MHWIAFAILVYVLTCLQAAVVPFFEVHTIRPDLVLIVAVFYALSARTYDALLACWFIGLAVDLSGISYQHHANVGIHAISLGLIALAIVKLRAFVFRESVLTQIVVTFVAKLLLVLLVGLHMLYVVDDGGRLGDVAVRGFYAAVYTAALAPYGHWFLKRFRTALGIGMTHRLRVR